MKILCNFVGSDFMFMDKNTLKREIIRLIKTDARIQKELIKTLSNYFVLRDPNNRLVTETYLDKQLAKLSVAFDKKLAKQSKEFDAKLAKQSKEFDEKLAKQSQEFREMLQQQSREFDAKLAKQSKEFDEKLAKQSQEFREMLQQQSKEFDAKLAKQSKEFDEKLAKQSQEFREMLQQQSREFDAKLAKQSKEFDEKLAKQSKEFDEKLAKQRMEIAQDMDEKLLKMEKRIKNYSDGIGSRWGIQTETALRKGLEHIVKEIYPGKVEKWEYKGIIKEISAHRKHYEIDVVVSNGTVILVEIKSSVTEDEVYGFLGNVMAYETITNRKCDKKLLVCSYATKEAIQLVKEENVHIETFIKDE